MRKHWYVTALVAVAALTALACENPGKVPSDRDPRDRQVDPAKARSVKIRAKSDGPYEVIVDAYDAKGGHEGWHEPVAGGTYKQSLDYTSGLKIRIRVEVKPGRKNDGAWCAIIDGLYHNDEKGPVRDGWRAICELTTTR